MLDFEYALVGGGLQSGLLALAIRARRPHARIALLERAGRLGGNHTWCFHDGDVSDASRGWMDPLITWAWPGYVVRFPGRERRVERPYLGISSERLHDVVSSSVGGHAHSELLLGTEVERVQAGEVRTTAGRTLRAAVVIDARGAGVDRGRCGYQKFVGVEMRLSEPHGLDRPVLMDATVEQSEGYRFVYVLPFSGQRILVEDTYFNTDATLDEERARARVSEYVAARGWAAAEVIREESGVLPMPWAQRLAPPGRGPLAAGYRGGWFHPGTGYSLPVAARLAEFVAARAPEDVFGKELQRFAARHRAQARFARFLNRLLFRWYPPTARRAVFERFYGLPQPTVDRFYALQLTASDRARLLGGKPPRGLSLRHRFGEALA